MKIQIEIINRKTTVTANGKTTEHNTVWLKSLKMSDFIQLVKDGKL